MILWTTPIIAVALYRSDSDSEGHLLTISISHYPLLSVFVFGFSIILHGFEFVTNNNNKKKKKKKKTNIGKIEEVGLVCCWKRRIGFEFFFECLSEMGTSESEEKMEGWLYLIRSNRIGLQYSRKRYFILEDHHLKSFKSVPISNNQVHPCTQLFFS